MERTSTAQEPGRRNRRLLVHCVGFLLLTNVLTILFVFALRRAAPAPVILQRVRPAAQEGSAPAAHAPSETRQVRVTSRPSGAVVTYQGQAVGTTPVSVALPAHAAGALEIAKEGFAARAVTVEPGKDEVHVRLVRDRRASRAGKAGTEQGAGQANDQAGDQAGGQAGDRPGTGQNAAPAAPAPTGADPARDPVRDPAGAGQGASPAPGTPEPARSSGRRSRVPAASPGDGARAGVPANPGP